MPKTDQKTGKLTDMIQRLRALPKRTKRIMAAGVIVIIALILLLSGSGKRPAARGAVYTEEAAEVRTIVKSISGSGTLQPANAYTVTTLIEGEVLSADFEKGSIVEKDTVLYEIDSSGTANNIEQAQISLNQAQRNYSTTADSRYVKAPVSGQVTSLSVAVGAQVNQGQSIGTVRDSSTMTLTVPFPADDAAGFFVGQDAAVTLDGSFETLSGTVHTVSAGDLVGTGNMVTRNVTIAVNNPGGLSDTQRASASIAGLNSAGSGTFTYRAESTLTASASGTVTAINAPEGTVVAQDQIILTLGGTNLENQIHSASDSLRSAELSMETTQNQLDNYTITSPIKGTIVEKQYKAGDTVSAGKTLCTIYDLSYLEIILNIDELDINSVAPGQTVQITADAAPGKTYEGTVTEISVAGTTTGGVTSYPVTVRLEDTDGLLPGMNVDTTILLETAKDVLSVPSGAVSRNGVLITKNSPSAVNATDQPAPDGYVYVQVETGISDDDYTQIISGLQQGDVIAYIPAVSGGNDYFMMMDDGYYDDRGPGGGRGMME